MGERDNKKQSTIHNFSLPLFLSSVHHSMYAFSYYKYGWGLQLLPVNANDLK